MQHNPLKAMHGRKATESPLVPNILKRYNTFTHMRNILWSVVCHFAISLIHTEIGFGKYLWHFYDIVTLVFICLVGFRFHFRVFTQAGYADTAFSEPIKTGMKLCIVTYSFIVVYKDVHSVNGSQLVYFQFEVIAVIIGNKLNYF